MTSAARTLIIVLLLGGCIATRPETPPAGTPPTPGSLATAPDRFVRSADVLIRYREVGAGDPMVLLHGYTDRLEMWNDAADSLARAFRVIVPDLRGFGESDKPASPAQYGNRMTADIVTLLDSLGIRAAHLVGYSMGALITADLAVTHPDRIRSAVLVAGPFHPDSAAFARALAPSVSALERGEGLVPFFRWIVPTMPDSILLPLVGQVAADNDSAALIAVALGMPQLVHPAAAFADVAIPAVTIVGRNDPAAANSRWLADRWPGIKLVELGDADHAVVFGVPEVVAEARTLAGR